MLQARSGSRAPGGLGLSSELSDSGLMELLEGKLAVLRFQVKIKEALERVASGGSGEEGGNAPMEEDGFPFSRAFTGAFADESRAYAAREKSEELSTELKSITQLYNDYACRFELWEVMQPGSGSCLLGRGRVVVGPFTQRWECMLGVGGVRVVLEWDQSVGTSCIRGPCWLGATQSITFAAGVLCRSAWRSCTFRTTAEMRRTA